MSTRTLSYTFWTKLRHLVKRLPYAQDVVFSTRLTFAPTYREDGLATVHNADFCTEPNFVNAYAEALNHQPGTEMRWRTKVALWAGSQALRLDGDFVECGVNRGFLAKAMLTYLGFGSIAHKRFFLFDTFCGPDPDLIQPRDRAVHWNEYEDVYEFVVKAFAAIPNVIIVKGSVPQSLRQAAIDKVAYLSIDMNCVVPEIAALKYFWPKLVDGGVVLLDDYGWRGHEAQKEAADNLVAEWGVNILPLPTGQGLIIK